MRKANEADLLASLFLSLAFGTCTKTKGACQARLFYYRQASSIRLFYIIHLSKQIQNNTQETALLRSILTFLYIPLIYFV